MSSLAEAMFYPWKLDKKTLADLDKQLEDPGFLKFLNNIAGPVLVKHAKDKSKGKL